MSGRRGSLLSDDEGPRHSAATASGAVDGGGLRAAVAFLTVLPVGRATRAGVARGTVFFPAVGAGFGLLCLGVVALPLDPLVAGTAAVAAAAALSGGLHWDAWADSMDAFFARVEPERARAILHDPRVGAHALWSGGALLILRAASIGGAPAWSIVAGPVVGRWVMVLSLAALRPFPESRLASDLHAGARPVAATAVALTLAAAGIAGGAPVVPLVVTCASSLAAATLAGAALFRRFGGANGDVHGALGLLAESCTWVIGAAWIR